MLLETTTLPIPAYNLTMYIREQNTPLFSFPILVVDDALLPRFAYGLDRQFSQVGRFPMTGGFY